MALSVRMSQRSACGSAALDSSDMRLLRNAIMLSAGSERKQGARAKLLLEAKMMLRQRKSEKLGGKSWTRPSLMSSRVALPMPATARGGSCRRPLMRTL